MPHYNTATRPVILRVCLLLFLAAGAVVSNAKLSGPERMDSLLKELPRQKEDTNKVLLLGELAYWTTSARQGIEYAGQALMLADQLSWEKGKALAHTRFGNNYYGMTDYTNALDHYRQALVIFKNIKDGPGVALVLTDIGLVYRRQKNYKKALEYSNESLQDYQALGLNKEMANAMVNICSIYADMGEYPKAFAIGAMSLKIRELLGDQNDIAESMQHLGSVCGSLKRYSDAFGFDFQALSIYRRVGNLPAVASTLTNIAGTYVDLVKDSAYTIIPDSFIASTPAGNLAKAISYVTESLDSSARAPHLDNLVRNYEVLSEAQRLQGKYKEALASRDMFIHLKDSLFSQKNAEAITLFETKMTEDAKNEQIRVAELKIAKERNERIFLSAGVLLLISVVIVVLRERRKSERLLLNILPAKVARELKSKGRSSARHFDNVTVLFSDFVNFTTAAERMTPAELIDELHTCFQAFDEITAKHGIEKIKTIGDAYLAVCGLPEPVEDHAERVMSAAIEIIAFMEKRGLSTNGNSFAIRIGIHTGSVVAGIVGVKKFAYDIWGDTVNTAARMEQHSEPGKINISESTYAIVGKSFPCNYRGEIEVKNKGKMRMYFLTPGK